MDFTEIEVFPKISSCVIDNIASSNSSGTKLVATLLKNVFYFLMPSEEVVKFLRK